MEQGLFFRYFLIYDIKDPIDMYGDSCKFHRDNYQLDKGATYKIGGGGKLVQEKNSRPRPTKGKNQRRKRRHSFIDGKESNFNKK